MPEKAVIEFWDVEFSYNGFPVLHKVNFSVQRGELVYIVGPNGGGKTTLLKLILGLLRPDSGKIRVFEEPPVKARSRVGYTPQHIQFDAQFPVTVEEVVAMGLLNGAVKRIFRNRKQDAVHEAMLKLEIDNLAKKPFSDLSGGQRQRVLIARSMVNKPELLLLDEPTSNVDIHTEDRLIELIDELNIDHTILLVSHDLNFVAGKVKNVICVNRDVHVHPTSEISKDAIRKVYEKNMMLVRHDLKSGNG